VDREEASLTTKMEEGFLLQQLSASDTVEHYTDHHRELLEVFEQQKSLASPDLLPFSILADVGICRSENHTCRRDLILKMLREHIPTETLLDIIGSFFCFSANRVLLRPCELLNESFDDRRIQLLLFTASGNVLFEMGDSEFLMRDEVEFSLVSTIDYSHRILPSLNILDLHTAKVFFFSFWRNTQKKHSCAVWLKSYIDEFLPEENKRVCNRCSSQNVVLE
jgi:hypothetical protein